MTKLLPLLFCTFFLTASIGCDKEAAGPFGELVPKQIELPAGGKEVIGNNNNFGIDLFTKTAVNEDGNLMLSPLSASAALTMLLNGCEGNTYTQVRDMLGYPGNLDMTEINEIYKSLVSQLLTVDPKVTLTLANAIFYRLDFEVKPPFLNTMDKEFGAHVEELDFNLPASVDVINKWASDNTNGKIPHVIDKISPLTVMFLMNALYFKGDWTYQFDESETKDHPFHFDDGTSVEVPTMTGNVGAKVYAGDNYRAVEMPYGQSNFSMVVIVPDGSLHDFFHDFSSGTWSHLTTSLDEQDVFAETTVMMPKFSFEYEKELNEPLQNMGMTDAFDPYVADLSGISDQDIFVSFVKQNTFVEVGEEGTEAAAVTTVGIEVTSYDPDRPPRFYVDQPFVFAIRERTTNTLLFIGGVTNPLD